MLDICISCPDRVNGGCTPAVCPRCGEQWCDSLGEPCPACGWSEEEETEVDDEA